MCRQRRASPRRVLRTGAGQDRSAKVNGMFSLIDVRYLFGSPRFVSLRRWRSVRRFPLFWVATALALGEFEPIPFCMIRGHGNSFLECFGGRSARLLVRAACPSRGDSLDL